MTQHSRGSRGVRGPEDEEQGNKVYKIYCLIMYAVFLALSTVFLQQLLNNSILGETSQQHALLLIYMCSTTVMTDVH